MKVVFQPKKKLILKKKNYRIVGLEHIETDLIKLKSLMSMKTHVPFPLHFLSMMYYLEEKSLFKSCSGNFSGICSGDIIVMRAKGALIQIYCHLLLIMKFLIMQSNIQLVVYRQGLSSKIYWL